MSFHPQIFSRLCLNQKIYCKTSNYQLGISCNRPLHCSFILYVVTFDQFSFFHHLFSFFPQLFFHFTLNVTLYLIIKVDFLKEWKLQWIKYSHQVSYLTDHNMFHHNYRAVIIIIILISSPKNFINKSCLLLLTLTCLWHFG